MRKARIASRILRASVAWLVSRKFLATCWVRPEAPSGRLPGLVMLEIMARTTPMKSMPGWVKKRWSSAATKASTHALGHGRDRHEHPLLAGILGEQPAVGGIEARNGRRLVVGQLLVVRQPMAEMPEQARHGARAYDQARRGEGHHDFEKLEHGPVPTIRAAVAKASKTLNRLSTVIFYAAPFAAATETIAATYAFLMAAPAAKWASTEPRSARARAIWCWRTVRSFSSCGLDR